MPTAPRLVLARCIAGLAAVMTFASAARASEVRVAVATNFAEVVEKIKPAFEARTGHRLTLTDRIYRQAVCADQERCAS